MADDRKNGYSKPSRIRRPGESSSARNRAEEEKNTGSKTVSNRSRKGSGVTYVSHTSVNSGKKTSQEKTEEKKKIENKSTTPVIILLIIFWVGVVLFTAFISYTYLVDKYKNPVTQDSIFIDRYASVEFIIERGATTKQIAHDLHEQGLIKNESMYRFLSKFNGYDGRYSAGTHILSEGLTYDEIMVILTGNPEVVTVLFPEGFTTTQIAARLETNKICSASDFLKTLETIDVSSYDFIKTETFGEHRDHRLDGYLFPDTYQFEVNSKPETVIYKMLNRFMEMFRPDFYVKAEEMGLTVDEVVTLASIVEKEAKLADERAKIAGVFMNRLKSDDPSMKYLQSCATIQYIYRKLYNRTLNTVTRENEQVSDWYNTYRLEGLTPGPICSPGIASIIAVLSYEEHDYYFFVATGDGTGSHYFSRTYDEHKMHGGT